MTEPESEARIAIDGSAAHTAHGTRARSPKLPLLIGGAAALVLAFGAGYWTAASPSGDLTALATPSIAVTTPSIEDTEAHTAGLLGSAYERCQEGVINRLRAPGSAVFPTLEEIDSTIGSREISISGYVDSENGFGALLRLRWSCQVGINSAGALLSAEVLVIEP